MRDRTLQNIDKETLTHAHTPQPQQILVDTREETSLVWAVAFKGAWRHRAPPPLYPRPYMH